MKRLKAFYNAFLWVLSFIIFTLIILFVAAVATGNKIFVVQTGSMTPTYPVGTLLVVQPASFDALYAGDVVTFYAGNAVVTHRIETIDEAAQTIVTKGDANIAPDAPIEYRSLIGKVRFGVKYAGYPTMWLRTKFGKIALFDIIIALFVIKICFRYFFGEDEETDED